MGQLVSIIIPVKNRSALFKDALASVIAQTYRPIEVIVVNDGSTPDEFLKIRELVFAENERGSDLKIKLIENKGKGAPAARNTGFRVSEGELIQFLDSDDILLPGKLSTQAEVLQGNPELQMVYCKAQFANENLEPMNKFWGREVKGGPLDYFLFPWQTMCPLYKRATMEEFGMWDEELQVNQDWELAMRYLILGCKVAFIDEAFAIFRKHSAGNIGDFKDDPYKVESKWRSTNKVYELLKLKGKLNEALKKAYFKRRVYILLLTAKLGDRNALKDRLHEVENDFGAVVCYMLKIFLTKRSAGIILNFYEKRINI